MITGNLGQNLTVEDIDEPVVPELERKGKTMNRWISNLIAAPGLSAPGNVKTVITCNSTKC